MKAEILFRSAWGKKGESHWVICFSSFLMRDEIAKTAQEYGIGEQSIRNYAKTYRLYRDLRDWLRDMYSEVIFISYVDQVYELRQLRHSTHYSNWFVVAERVYHEDASRRIDLETALDWLRAGSDMPNRTFKAFVGGNELTRTRAFMSALNGIKKALLFPMTRRDKRILLRAKAIVEKRR